MHKPVDTPLRSRTWTRRAIGLGAILIIAYAGVIAYLVAYETDLIFRPRRSPHVVTASLGLAPIRIATAAPTDTAGTRHLAWRLETTRSPHWIVYLHGNSATISSPGNVIRYHQLQSLGLNLYAPEYPGFGELEGMPSERGMKEAARLAFDDLRAQGVPARDIAIYGWSLGSGAAVPLARDVDEAALIVEGAFTSVLRRAQAEYPFLPISWMVHHPFLSVDVIEHTGSATLFLHSPEDTIVPFADGRELFARAREPKRLIELRGGHITPNLDDEDRFVNGIATFLSSHAGWTLDPPRRSVVVALSQILERDGLEATLAAYRRMRTEGDRVWNLAEYELGHLGTTLSAKDRHQDAIALLRLNVEMFPKSQMARFQLGRALEAADDESGAREAYRASLSLDGSAANPSYAALERLD